MLDSGTKNYHHCGGGRLKRGLIQKPIVDYKALIKFSGRFAVKNGIGVAIPQISYLSPLEAKLGAEQSSSTPPTRTRSGKSAVLADRPRR